ncbi:response regulator [Pseudomaricurvus alcaniphilus]|uniref:ATP-binding protein n=1 Tax=Pseudomaricurvus alcaniphilus TaxID=1166482 RepID=UPI00140C6E58|nr:ATP-binding protein [Pseudomaricurvus alcaniphilus]NHN37221.1 response regulator [Pseudomaricurvus alcaniphilus]
MHSAKPTIDEKERLAELFSLKLLDTDSEERFDAITRYIKSHFSVPIALISLVDSERQWFKSKQGLEVCETDRSLSFCGHAIHQEEVFVVEDTLKDERFADNPLVISDPKIRFYAGYPLHTENGYRIGTLCIIDTCPRLFTHQNKVDLHDAGQIVEAHIRQRSAEMALGKSTITRGLWRWTKGYPSCMGRRDVSLLCAAIVFSIIMAIGWQVSFVSLEGWKNNWSGYLWRYELYALMAALISALIYYLLRLPRKLRLTLDKNTAARIRSERRFRDAIEALPEGFMIFDADKRLSIYNDNLVKLYPFVKKAIQSGAARQLLSENYDQCELMTEAHVHPPCSGRTPAPSEDIKLEDGRWLRVVQRAMRDGGTVCLHTDISDLKASEKALCDAKESAEQANRTKTRFLANVSHEVRTPLNSVLGLLEVLQEDQKLNDRQQYYIKTAKDSASHLLLLLNDILDISMIEAENVALTLSPLNIEDLVRSIASQMTSKVREKDLLLKVTVMPGMPDNLLGDQDRIRQILLNTLDNAIKFTDTGSVEIYTGFESVSDSQMNVIFRISDTGIGIPEEHIETVFDPFTRNEPEANNCHGGIGLGLSICRKLVTAMQGKIYLDSEPGRGTTVQVCLPLVVDSRPGEGVKNRIASAGEYRHSDQRPCCVLLVDDVKTNQLVITSMLDAHNYEIDIASDGVEAVAAAMIKHYDVILMDISMPNLDGVAAARKIRAPHSNNSSTPIIAFTANAMAGDREKFLQAGMNDYLAKPVRKADLLDMIQRWEKVSS